MNPFVQAGLAQGLAASLGNYYEIMTQERLRRQQLAAEEAQRRLENWLRQQSLALQRQELSQEKELREKQLAQQYKLARKEGKMQKKSLAAEQEQARMRAALSAIELLSNPNLPPIVRFGTYEMLKTQYPDVFGAIEGWFGLRKPPQAAPAPTPSPIPGAEEKPTALEVPPAATEETRSLLGLAPEMPWTSRPMPFGEWLTTGAKGGLASLPGGLTLNASQPVATPSTTTTPPSPPGTMSDEEMKNFYLLQEALRPPRNAEEEVTKLARMADVLSQISVMEGPLRDEIARRVADIIGLPPDLATVQRYVPPTGTALLGAVNRGMSLELGTLRALSQQILNLLETGSKDTPEFARTLTAWRSLLGDLSERIPAFAEILDATTREAMSRLGATDVGLPPAPVVISERPEGAGGEIAPLPPLGSTDIMATLPPPPRYGQAFATPPTLFRARVQQEVRKQAQPPKPVATKASSDEETRRRLQNDAIKLLGSIANVQQKISQAKENGDIITAQALENVLKALQQNLDITNQQIAKLGGTPAGPKAEKKLEHPAPAGKSAYEVRADALDYLRKHPRGGASDLVDYLAKRHKEVNRTLIEGMIRNEYRQLIDAAGALRLAHQPAQKPPGPGFSPKTRSEIRATTKRLEAAGKKPDQIMRYFLYKHPGWNPAWLKYEVQQALAGR